MKAVVTQKYVYHPYRMEPIVKRALGTRTFRLLSFFRLRNIRTPLFEGWKINGNGNGEVFNRRAKSFCETVLLWTVNSLYEIMAVFAVSDQSTKSSKLGYRVSGSPSAFDMDEEDEYEDDFVTIPKEKYDSMIEDLLTMAELIDMV